MTGNSLFADKVKNCKKHHHEDTKNTEKQNFVFFVSSW